MVGRNPCSARVPLDPLLASELSFPAPAFPGSPPHLPRAESFFGHQHAHRMPALAVRAHRKDEFEAALAAARERPLAFVEILIDVAALRRIGLEAAHGGSAAQR